MLKKGHLIGVAPGGGYEAQLGTNEYKASKYKKTCNDNFMIYFMIDRFCGSLARVSLL